MWDTENTNNQYRFKYLEPQLSIGGVNALYQSADLPGIQEQPEFYMRTDAANETLTLVYDGLDTVNRIESLKTMVKHAKGKSSPPVCIFKLGNLPMKTVVVTAVNPQYDLSYNSDGFPDISLIFIPGYIVPISPNAGRIFRARVTLTMKPVPEPKGVFNALGL
ncbi:MAG: hypothetical protein ACRDBG_22320 [Waterburya sp.]